MTSESPQGPKLENRGSKIAASFEFRVSLARHPSLLTHDRGQQVSGFRLERLGRRQAGSALGARDSALRERRLGFLHFRSLKLAWRGLRPQRVERPLPTPSLPSCSNLIRRQLSMASLAFRALGDTSRCLLVAEKPDNILSPRGVDSAPEGRRFSPIGAK